MDVQHNRKDIETKSSCNKINVRRNVIFDWSPKFGVAKRENIKQGIWCAGALVDHQHSA